MAPFFVDRAGTVRQNVDLPDCISADVVADDVTIHEILVSPRVLVT